MEKIPIVERELLIRYGRLSPNARDRVLDQFYLLVPGSPSLHQYIFHQTMTIGLAVLSGVTAAVFLFTCLNSVFHFDSTGVSAFMTGLILLLELAVVVYAIRRRIKYRKRYHERLMQPTEIGLSKSRISVHHRVIHVGCVTQSMQWDEIVHAGIVEGPEGEGDIIELQDQAGKVMQLRLDYIQTIEERQILRDFIEDRLPQINVKPVTTEILRIGKRDDIPFTRLWCQALRDSRPRVNTEPLAIGWQLQDGRFTIVNCIGGGGQGTVYEADVEGLEGKARIVLKEYVLPDTVHAAEHKAACEQFEKEIRLLGLVSHEKVIKMLDAFVEDHRAYLVLEHVDGISLKDRVEKSGRLEQENVVALALQMCEILRHLHEREPAIMHLDFSPENILLSSDGKIVLIDFNISVEADAIRTRTVMGKQRYMAPEQYRGTPGPASDIYSFGATLFYLITGREPEPISTARAAKYVDGIAEELDAILAKCTALELEDRFKTVADLEVSLSKLAATRSAVVSKP